MRHLLSLSARPVSIRLISTRLIILFSISLSYLAAEASASAQDPPTVQPTLFEWLSFYGVGGIYDWMTNQENPFGAPYVNPSSTKISNITSIGAFDVPASNNTNLEIGVCEQFNSAFKMAKYTMQLITFNFVRVSAWASGGHLSWIDRLLLKYFSWTPHTDNTQTFIDPDTISGPRLSEIFGCFIPGLGLLLEAFFIIFVSGCALYIFWQIYGFFKARFRDQLLELRYEDQCRFNEEIVKRINALEGRAIYAQGTATAGYTENTENSASSENPSTFVHPDKVNLE